MSHFEGVDAGRDIRKRSNPVLHCHGGNFTGDCIRELRLHAIGRGVRRGRDLHLDFIHLARIGLFYCTGESVAVVNHECLSESSALRQESETLQEHELKNYDEKK